MSSSSSESQALPHYPQSPSMIAGKTHCTRHTNEQLKEMGIDRRWECDNRIPTWNFGMVNFRFDQNFMQNGSVINATDDTTQTILADKDDGTREITGTRRIAYNGSWFRLD